MTSTPETRNDTRVKVGHLVAGLVFLGLAGVWALGAGGVIGDVSGAVVLSLVLVGAGAIGLVAMLAGGLTGRRPAPAYPFDEGDPEPGLDEENTDTDTEEIPR